jgi:hypothetical protein
MKVGKHRFRETITVVLQLRGSVNGTSVHKKNSVAFSPQANYTD